MMAGTKETAEGLANLILGCCAAAWFNGGAGAVVTGAVGAVGVGALLYGKLEARNPESAATLARLRRDVIDGYMARTETLTAQLDLAEADLALGRRLPECMLDHAALAASARSGQSFPETATALVITRLAEKEPIFAEPGTHPAANRLARDFAEAVLRAALTAALDSREWFERLEPRLMMEALQGIGEVSNKIDARSDRLEAQLAALSLKLEGAGVFQEARDKGLTEAQVTGILRAFTAQNFSLEDAEALLLKSAEELLALRDQLSRLKNRDVEVSRLRAQAVAAIDAGDLASARAALAQARSRAADIAEGQMRTVADLDLEQGHLARAEGRLLEAADHYAAAAAYLTPIDASAADEAWAQEFRAAYDHGEVFPGLNASRRAADLARSRVARMSEPRQQAEWRIRLGAALQTLGARAGGEAGLTALEEAVAAYRAALEVYTRKDMPADWAMTQNNLGIALRTLGERAGGEAGLSALEEAVAAYRAALEVYTRKDMPADWAMTQNNLGNALQNLGERAGGEAGLSALEEAVAAYREALKVYTRKDMPANWAGTQNNLGNALQYLGELAGGEAGLSALEEAVAAYREAQEVYTHKDTPADWAMTQNNMGRALRILGERAGGEVGLLALEEAVAAYREAQEVYTRKDMPVAWAMTQHNLGNALSTLGERAGGEAGLTVLEEAVAAYRAALEVRTRKDMPVAWAYTTENYCIVETAKSEIAREPEPVCRAVDLMDQVIAVYIAMRADFYIEQARRNQARMRALCIELGGSC